MQSTAFPALPCYPCPHASACCAYGATLSDAEVEAIHRVHGKGKTYQTRWGEWRTRVAKGRCAFLRNNSCSIYDQPYYPAVCRGFPFVDAESGGPYEFEREICPEFELRPELHQINPFRTSSPPAP
jgi:Fe-S-cluster containining protein